MLILLMARYCKMILLHHALQFLMLELSHWSRLAWINYSNAHFWVQGPIVIIHLILVIPILAMYPLKYRRPIRSWYPNHLRNETFKFKSSDQVYFRFVFVPFVLFHKWKRLKVFTTSKSSIPKYFEWMSSTPHEVDTFPRDIIFSWFDQFKIVCMDNFHWLKCVHS
jgi:hypothetical protein